MNKINKLLAALLIVGAVAAPAAKAADSNLGATGYLNTQVGATVNTGTLNQSASSFSGGSTQASSNGSGLGSSGSETSLTSKGQATTTGAFTNNGINVTSNFSSDTLSQTFGIAPVDGGLAQSSGTGGSNGSALSSGTLEVGTIGLQTTGGFQAGLGLTATGSGFGH